jgi:hypothetical protein
MPLPRVPRRRARVATAVLAGAALLLGACSSSDGEPRTSTETPVTTTTTIAAPIETVGGVIPVVEGVSAEQRAAALDLVERTHAAIVRYADTGAAEEAGYRSIGDAITGFEHYVHREHTANATVLDPGEIESLVYRVEDDGSRTLVSGMYILPPGSTMDDVPDIAGPITAWHDHQNLCWDPDDPARLAGILVNGTCVPGGVFRATAPMLHVWVEPHPCGPFAGIEGGPASHGEGCDAAHHGDHDDHDAHDDHGRAAAG